jgi:hypothetical protein
MMKSNPPSNESITDRDAVLKKILAESNCYDRFKIHVRAFFTWLLYRKK